MVDMLIYYLVFFFLYLFKLNQIYKFQTTKCYYGYMYHLFLGKSIDRISSEYNDQEYSNQSYPLPTYRYQNFEMKN